MCVRAAVILFCLFHMAAIAAFSIDTSWGIAPLTAFRDAMQPWTNGYVLMTSQWQRWNLFSPDPLRRVSRYAVERNGAHGWERIFMIVGNSAEGSGILKTLRRLEERNAEDPLLKRFLIISCTTYHIPAGTPVRLKRIASILPYPKHPLRIAEWHAYRPQWSEDILANALCPNTP